MEPDCIERAARARRDKFVQVALGACATKAEVMKAIATAFGFPASFGANLDALYDALTDLAFDAPMASEAGEAGEALDGPRRGYAIVLEALPVSSELDDDAREALLDVFRDAAEFHAGHAKPFRVFYSLH
jgi:RNAse (barnase) inhibitor barstar